MYQEGFRCCSSDRYTVEAVKIGDEKEGHDVRRLQPVCADARKCWVMVNMNFNRGSDCSYCTCISCFYGLCVILMVALRRRCQAERP